jgi:uracil-DNA glycosylase
VFSPRLEETLPEQLPERWAKLVGEDGLSVLASIGREIDKHPGQKAMLTPHPEAILRAFDTPPQMVKTVIIGQDPYPGAGHAMGLAFSVGKHVSPLPPSLRNIRQEYQQDLGLPVPSHGDLDAWTKNGVLLLNRHLTTLVGAPGAHRTLGWSRFTDLVVTRLVDTGQFFVSILWGREASELAPLLGDNPRIESAHPSPLSARLGFFGSKPFSRTNQYCEDRGVTPIDWSLEGHPDA